MKCLMPDCNATLHPEDIVCPECGLTQADKAAPNAALEPAILQVPQLAAAGGRYSAEISRQNPGCLLFLVDQSGSMEEPIAGGTGEKKKQVVADAINRP